MFRWNLDLAINWLEIQATAYATKVLPAEFWQRNMTIILSQRYLPKAIRPYKLHPPKDAKLVGLRLLWGSVLIFRAQYKVSKAWKSFVRSIIKVEQITQSCNYFPWHILTNQKNSSKNVGCQTSHEWYHSCTYMQQWLIRGIDAFLRQVRHEFQGLPSSCFQARLALEWYTLVARAGTMHLY